MSDAAANRFSAMTHDELVVECQRISFRLEHCDVARLGAINAHGKAFEEREALRRQLDECAEYLKEGETPAECIQRNRDDATRVLGMLAKDRKALEDARSRLEQSELRERDGDVIAMGHEIERLRFAARDLIRRLELVGNDTKWVDGQQTDRVFYWAEFDDLRIALGDTKPRYPDDLPESSIDYDDATQVASVTIVEIHAPVTRERPPIEPDDEGDCKRCGLGWSMEEIEGQHKHECPPGFLT